MEEVNNYKAFKYNRYMRINSTSPMLGRDTHTGEVEGGWVGGADTELGLEVSQKDSGEIRAF
jgi:hypothetical protein